MPLEPCAVASVDCYRRSGTRSSVGNRRIVQNVVAPDTRRISSGLRIAIEQVDSYKLQALLGYVRIGVPFLALENTQFSPLDVLWFPFVGR